MSKNNRSKKKTKKRSLSRATAPASPATIAGTATADSTVAAAPAVSVAPAAPAASERDPRTAYVGTDIRRIGIITTICILLELGLWYLFASTQLGSQIYQLFTP